MTSEIIQGWKAIASYLRRDERTVRRWEKQHELPVRRVTRSRSKSGVYAVAAELDEWLLRPTPLKAVDESPTYLPEPVTPVARESAPPVSSGSLAVVRFLIPAMLAILCASTVLLSRSFLRQGAGWTSGGPAVGKADDLMEADLALESRTPESLERATELYAEHLMLDARSGASYTGLAKAYCFRREYSTLPAAEAYEKAQEMAAKALVVNPNDADAHAVLGFVNFFWFWNVDAAEKQFHTAIRLSPQSALARQWYGSMLMHQGKMEPALQQLRIAQQLDPASVPIASLRVMAMSLSGDRGRANAILGELEQYFPNAEALHRTSAFVSLQAPRDPERYLAETARSAELEGDQEKAAEARAAAVILRSRGEMAMWQTLLDHERERPATGRPSLQVAQLEAIVGDEDAAVRYAAAIVQQHDDAALGIPMDPTFAALRSQGKLQAALVTLPYR